MVSCDWHLDRTDGVTLVRIQVDNPGPAREVHVENRLDGAVWPPRRQGRPAAGWDDTGFEGVVAAGGRLTLGYASPAEPTEPPVAVTADPVSDDVASGGPTSDAIPTSDAEAIPTSDAEAIPTSDAEAIPTSDADDAGVPADVTKTPAGVVRSLGDPIVPRAAVPVPDVPESPAPAGGEGSRPAGDDSHGQRRTERGRTQHGRDEPGQGDHGPGEGGASKRGRRNQKSGGRGERGAAADGVGALLARIATIERRLATLEGR